MVTVSPSQAASITGAQNWDAMRAQHPDDVDRMADGLVKGDRLADAVVAEFFTGSGLGWKETIGALDTPFFYADLPPALTEFLKQTTTPPSWFDPALAQAGANAWWRFGSLQSTTLYQSLIYGYQARGFTRPLAETGRLTERTWDRVYATGKWVALATAPEQMEVGASGWVESLRIRLVHAMVRHHLIERQGWDVEAWGVPINQTYSQFTITAGFCALPLRVAKDLGLRYSPAELEAITHLWRWIGWTMGVDDELLPKSYADAQRIYKIATEFRMEPDDSGKVLTKALLRDGYAADFGLPGPLNTAVHMMARPFLKPFFATMSSRWMDPATAEALGLRPGRLNNFVVLARPVVRSRELLRSMGLMGPDTKVAARELRLVTSRFGLDLADPDLAKRYQQADSGKLEKAS